MLHKINSLVEQILSETLDDVKNKYYKDIDGGTFSKLIALDPTFNVKKDKLGMYGKWILSIYKNIKEEDFYKVTEYLQEFEQKKKHFSNKDIFQFKSLPALAKAIREISDGDDDDELSDRQKLRQMKKKGEQDAKIVYSDDKWEIREISTYEASCKYGAGTEWCTATTRSRGPFDNYTKEGPLFIFMDKTDKDDEDGRLQLALFHSSIQFMDTDDSPVNLREFLQGNPKIGEFISNTIRENNLLEKDSIYFHLIINPTKEDIQSFAESLDGFQEVEDNTVVYKVGLDTFVDIGFTDEVRDAVSKSSIKEAIFGDFTVEGFGYPDDSQLIDTLSYLKTEASVILAKANLTIEDLETYMEDDTSDESEEIIDKANVDMDGFIDSLRDAHASAEEQGYVDEFREHIGKAIRDVFNFEFKYNEHNTNIVLRVPISHLIESLVYYHEYYGDGGGEYGIFEEYWWVYTILSTNEGGLLSVKEPYGGFVNFSDKYFLEGVEEAYLEHKKS